MWMDELSEMPQVLAQPLCSADVRLTVPSDKCAWSTLLHARHHVGF